MTDVATPPAASDRLPDDAALGVVSLTVTDLERSVAFYDHAIGLQLRHRASGRALLGDTTTDVLELVEDAGARPQGRHAGLYHVALLFPGRVELARALERLIANGTSIDGASDHGTHEAIYLPDPDGNGLELAADRPREQWPSAEQLLQAGRPDPLDIAGLRRLVQGEARATAAGDGIRVGHVHLHVDDLDAATRFYRDVIGLDVTMALPHAVFLSFGGYHHHVAINVWRGRGIPGVPADAVGMRHIVLEVPADAMDAVAHRIAAAGFAGAGADGRLLVADPAGNEFALVARPRLERRSAHD